MKKDPQIIFQKIDKFISIFYQKLGFKKARILTINDPNYWNNILTKIRISLIGVLALYVGFYYYNNFIFDKIDREGLIGRLIYTLPSQIYFSYLGIFICSFIVIKNFADGKEKLKGNDRIQWIHLYYMFALPIMLVGAMHISSWIY